MEADPLLVGSAGQGELFGNGGCSTGVTERMLKGEGSDAVADSDAGGVWASCGDEMDTVVDLV